MKNLLILLMVTNAMIFGGCQQNNDKSTEQKQAGEQQQEETAQKAPEAAQIIAFINTDTLLDKYQLAIDLREKLNAEKIKYETILSQKERKLYDDLAQLQRDAPTLSQFEGQTRQRKLYEEQDKLQQLQETYFQKLANREEQYNRQMNQAIHDFLETYCADKPYEMVISNSELGIIRWARKELDITSEVLEGLNAEYNAQKAAMENTAGGNN